MDFHLISEKEWLDLIFRRRENQIPSFSLRLTNDCKISLSLVFPFRFFGLNFILVPFPCASVGRRFRGPKPNVLFIAIDDLNDWVGCMGGHRRPLPRIWTVWPPPAFCSKMPIVRLRLQPFTRRSLRGFHLTVGVIPERAKDEGRDAGSRTVAQNLFQSGYWSGGSGKMLHYFIDAPSWDEYFPRRKRRTLFQRPWGRPSVP